MDTERDQRIQAAVDAWGRETPHGQAEPLLQLPTEERKEALRRLGYNTPTHLELFGLT